LHVGRCIGETEKQSGIMVLRILTEVVSASTRPSQLQIAFFQKELSTWEAVGFANSTA